MPEFGLQFLNAHPAIQVEPRADVPQVVGADVIYTGYGFHMTPDHVREPLARPCVPLRAFVGSLKVSGCLCPKERVMVSCSLWSDSTVQIDPHGGLREEREVHGPVFITLAMLDDQL